MIIEISGLVFKCEVDETIFFSRLYELPSYHNVVNNGLSLYLTLTEESKESAIKELQIICDTWGATFKILEE